MLTSGPVELVPSSDRRACRPGSRRPAVSAPAPSRRRRRGLPRGWRRTRARTAVRYVAPFGTPRPRARLAAHAERGGEQELPREPSAPEPTARASGTFVEPEAGGRDASQGNADPRRHTEHTERSHEREAARREEHDQRNSGGERDPRAAAEREVQRRRQEREGGARDDAWCEARRFDDEPECEQRRGRGHEPEPVPVPDRRREPVAGDRVGDAEPVGEQAGRERVDTDQRRSRPGAPEQRGDRPSACDRDRRHRERGIDERALDLERGLRLARRPRDRRGGPRAEQKDAAEPGKFERAGPLGAESERHERGCRQRQCRPPPAGRPVPAVVGGDRRGRDRRERDRRRRCEVGAQRGKPGPDCRRHRGMFASGVAA